MAYYLKAWIAKTDALDRLAVDYRELKQGFGITTQDCSHATADHNIMFAEADYFGGVGEQSAIWWIDGHSCSVSDSDGAIRDRTPISEGLAALGVIRGDYDEFDSVGLSDERSNNWLESSE